MGSIHRESRTLSGKRYDMKIKGLDEKSIRDAAKSTRISRSERRHENGGPAMKRRSSYVVVQEGGSSLEVYAHVHNTLAEAEADRKSCAEASYRTSEPVAVPRALADAPDFIDVVEDILAAFVRQA